jgi:hypothetical protein
MKYQDLDPTLVPVAEAARKHFATVLGVRKFKAEREISSDLLYRPTLSGATDDFGIVAIEVINSAYTQVLDEFIIHCLSKQLPMRFYLAAPSGLPSSLSIDLVRRAKKRSIGIVEVNGSVVTEILAAVPLSLSGLRRIDMRRFPAEYHARLAKAEQTFLNGDPAKGCGRVFDLVERHTRAIAAEVKRLSLWLPSAVGTKAIKFRGDTAWSTVLGIIEAHAKFDEFPVHGLKLGKPLWNRVRGMTPHRNESGHEPSTEEELRQRDTELRTRFEHAADTLTELAKATPAIVATLT